MSTPPNEVRQWDEAVLWFLARVPMTKAEWTKLSARARRRAFTVAGVAQADVLHDVFKGIDRAVAKGTGLEEFRKSVGQKLRSAWQGSVKNPAWRLETIYRTNVQHAYSAGRWAQMTDPVVTKHRPFGMFDAILDNRVTERCEELDGTILAWEEWQKRGLVPPLHFNCRSGLRSLRKSQAEKKPGWGKTPPDVASQDGFGLPPQSAEWQPALEKYPPELRNHVQSRLAGADALEPMQAPEGARFVGIQEEPLEDGVHVKSIVGELSETQIAEVVSVLDHPAILRRLEGDEKLHELNFVTDVTSASAPPNFDRKAGAYSRWTDTIWVNAARPRSSYGKAFNEGISYTISSCAKTLTEAMRASLLHEVAHRFTFRLPVEFQRRIRSRFGVLESQTQDPSSETGFITKRASLDWREYFSELFACLHSEARLKALAAYDPDGYGLLKEFMDGDLG